LNASIFRTETRAVATDAVARAKFRRYWSFLSPGISLIRRAVLVESGSRAARALCGCGKGAMSCNGSLKTSLIVPIVPDLAGGSSFTSPSFDPVRRLFFVSARETCQVFTSSPPAKYELGDFVTGGGSRDRGGTGALRAIDPVTLERKWEVPYGGPSYSGVLSTASGLVFAGDHAGTLMGVKAETGQVWWRHRLPGTFWGAPSTVMVGKQQLLLMASGQTLTAFASPPAGSGALPPARASSRHRPSGIPGSCRPEHRLLRKRPPGE
jgi:hypothetical protein